MVKIDKITIKHEIEEQSDLAYLGEYSDIPADVHIDRQKRGDCKRNEYQYFNLGCGDAGYIEQDYQRAENYNKSHWFLMGITATAQVSYDVGQDSRRIEWLSSDGLWGIESDSGQEHIESIEKDQLANLKTHLEQFGVDMSNFVELAERI